VEEVGGRQNAIVVPVSGLEQFRDMLSEIINTASRLLAGVRIRQRGFLGNP